MSCGLELVVLYSMHQLRLLYGFDCQDTAKRVLNELDQANLAELKEQTRRTSLETPARRLTLQQDFDPDRPRMNTHAGELTAIRSEGDVTSGGAPASESELPSSPPKLALKKSKTDVQGMRKGIELTTLASKRQRRDTSNRRDTASSAERAQDFALRAELLSRNLQRQKTMGAADMKKGAVELLRDSANGVDDLPCPRQHIWAARHIELLKQLLQIIMLYSCGQVALYALSLAYGIEDTGVGGAWHLFALFPPCFTLFVFLPHLCQKLALFEAYSVPNAPILDNVISDIDQRTMDLRYLKDQLAMRVDQSHDPDHHRFGKNLAARLEAFEAQFEWKYTPLRRWWAAFSDLARGQALCFVDKSACFLVGVLAEANIPASRERLERLVPWYKEEVAVDDELRVEDLFIALNVPMPANPQRTTGNVQAA